MKKHALRVGPASLLVFSLGLVLPGAAAAASCAPQIEGPVPVTATSKPYSKVDLPDAGATEEEFFLSCDVTAGHYKTLIHVNLPKAAGSGIVVVEPWHPGDLWPLYAKVSEYEARAGHVHVVVVGNPFLLDTAIKKQNPARYGSLTIPGTGARSVAQTPAGQTAEFEILAQVGAFIKSGGLPGVKARKVILGGMSQTGGVTRAYIAWEHPGPGAKSVYDGYFPEQAAGGSYKTPIPDLDVPVVELQGEREMMVSLNHELVPIPYRRADGPLYRLYEVPGMPHVATRGRPEGGGTNCSGHTHTDFPTFYVYGATLKNLINWVDKGIAAPHVARIKTEVGGREIMRDSAGNALGGYRTSYVDVPKATYHATWGDYYLMADGKPSDAAAQRCDKMGWIAPLSSERLKKLYPTHADYVSKVGKSLDGLVKAKLMLPEDAKDLRDEANQAKIP